jgi:hypothetical protein
MPYQICVNFFDDSTLTPVQPDNAPPLGVRYAGGRKQDAQKGTSISTGGFSYQLPDPNKRTTDQKNEAQILSAEIYLKEELEAGCGRYAGSVVSFTVSDQAVGAGNGTCCCIPFPLHKLIETCSIKFAVIDVSRKDSSEHSASFLGDMQWKITSIRTPVPALPANAAPGSTANAPAPVTSAYQYQPLSLTVRSNEGVAEAFDIPLRQLFQVEALPPDGYICEASALQYRYICCEKTIEITTRILPCRQRRIRSVVFVQQKCEGARWTNATVVVAGTELPVDGEGIAHISRELNGQFAISAPGKSFSPSTLDLTDGGPPVTTVAVSDQPVSQSKSTVHGQFLDDSDEPFANRRLTVLLSNGQQMEVVTDEDGYFDAPHGSRVCAKQDEFGPATEPLLLTN